MPTSSYQADVQVHIAWNAGQRTPAASYTWTDVSTYVEFAEGITINGGRSDERSTADANHLVLTFDNSDGRFTAGKTSGPYGSNVKLDRPIKVTATPVDGAAQILFLGFVDDWPLEWESTDGYALATISASSRLSRLGLAVELKSIIEETVLVDTPLAYYTLGEPAGSTQANDSSGNARDPLTIGGTPSSPAIVFGNAIGPGTDSLTAAEFFGFGPNLQAAIPFVGSGLTMETYFSAPSAPSPLVATLVALFPGSGGGSTGVQYLFINATTGALGASTPFGGVLSATNVCDGDTHHAAVTWNGATVTLYLDGASIGSAAAVGSPSGDSLLVGQGMTGVLAHVAVYGSALSAARVAEHASAGLTGFAGDLTSARLARYAALAGIPAAEVSAETGQTTMAHLDTTDRQVVEMMRVTETTEGGVLHDGRDGLLLMHNRAHRYVLASSFTLDMASQHVEAGYSPKYDRTGLLNDVTASNVGGTVTARKFDGPGPGTSVYEYGLAKGAIETASADPNQPNDYASWLVYRNATPKERVPSLTVNALAQVGKTPNCATVLAATVGTKITVAGRPTQAATSSVDYFVEGYTIAIGPESLFVTWNLSPSSPDDQVLVIDDAVRGVIDTNPIAF